METGVNINPVTLRPKQQGAQERQAERKARTDVELRKQAEDLALGFSKEGELFKGLLLARLEQRTMTLIREDPEAGGYLKVLQDMGHRFNAAKTAADKLYQQHMGQHMGIKG
jgi:hypothetical protein